MLYKIQFVLMIFISNLVFCQKQFSLNSFSGTWMNIEYYKQLSMPQNDSLGIKSVPRIIYIDKVGNVSVENRFEQIGKSKLKLIKKANNILYYSNCTITTFEDTLVVLNYFKLNKKKYFKKISNNYSCISCGMQYFFNNYFWGNVKKWKMISLRNLNADTLFINIKYGRILSHDFKKVITEYEFTDIYKSKVNDEILFNILFFRTKANYTMSDKQLYAIKKGEMNVLLYKNGKLVYIFSPMH